MTEYDFSPEAYEKHLATQHRIARWVDSTEKYRPHFESVRPSEIAPSPSPGPQSHNIYPYPYQAHLPRQPQPHISNPHDYRDCRSSSPSSSSSSSCSSCSSAHKSPAMIITHKSPIHQPHICPQPFAPPMSQHYTSPPSYARPNNQSYATPPISISGYPYQTPYTIGSPHQVQPTGYTVLQKNKHGRRSSVMTPSTPPSHIYQTAHQPPLPWGPQISSPQPLLGYQHSPPSSRPASILLSHQLGDGTYLAPQLLRQNVYDLGNRHRRSRSRKSYS